MKNVTIVVPVYGDWSSLRDCIESLKKYVGKRHRVLFANDCGPEADLIERNIKKAIKSVGHFSYVRNDKNLGFVQNCNNAVLKIDKTDNDILLLNSDTIVTKGFLEELLAVLYSSNDIGAVSPRSNNATIATIPIASTRNKGGLTPEASYNFFIKNNKNLPRYTIAPVAHGFCMLVRRELIKRYGLFDEVFGKGYGEEVDFCLRIRGHGYESAISNWAYVFHLEGRSFGLDKKAALIKESSKIILERYPSYKQEVQKYIDDAIINEEILWLRKSYLKIKQLLRNWR